MPTLVTVLLVLSILMVLIDLIVSVKGNDRTKTISMVVTYSLIAALAVSSSIYSLNILFGNIVIMIILLMSGIILYMVLEFVLEKALKNNNKYMKLLPSLVLYVLAITGEFIYFGFNFVELISFSAAAIIFYLSIYILKREENAKRITTFFIYTVIVSYFLGKSFSGMILSDTINLGMEVCVPLFIGSLLIYLSNIVKDSDIIFDFERKEHKNVFTLIPKALLEIGLILISLSLVFAI